MKKILIMTACLLLMTGCNSNPDSTAESSKTESISQTSAAENVPDMSEAEAISIAKSAVEDEITSIPSYEIPDDGYFTFERFGAALFETSEATYNADSNTYTVKLSGYTKLVYSVNGVGLAGNDIRVEFDTTVKVMIRNGDTSFPTGFKYDIVNKT